MVSNDDVLRNIYEGKVIADSGDAYEALEFWMTIHMVVYHKGGNLGFSGLHI